MSTTSIHAVVGAAVQAFEEAERAHLLAAKKGKALSLSVLAMAADETVTAEDRAEYFRLTEEIRAKFQEKAEKAGVML